MDILPLTPGMLSSAMMRYNHAVFMPSFGEDADPISRMMGTPEERIPRALDAVLAKYDQAVSGSLADVQLLEEFTGTGFYRPESEQSYVAALDQFHGMLALVLDRLAARSN